MSGGPGIGKTTLWRTAAEAAAAAGARVLRVRCAEVEMPIALGHLADLLGGVAAEVGPALPSPQRDALEAALGIGGSPTVRPDTLAIARATLSALAQLASAGRVVVAIDDAQWLDPGTLRVLAYALRRTTGSDVAAILSVRDEAGIDDPLALADHEGFERIHLGPLTVGALQHVVRTRLGTYLPRPTLARIHEASGGNPMFALEFARLVESAPASVAPLSVPRSLEEVVAARVSSLPRELAPLLEAVSALERASFPVLVEVLGDPERVEELVARAVADEALARDDDLLSFSHPLLRAAVYFRMPRARRRELHHRLARVVSSVEERGRHAALACDAPDAETAALVARAADAAAARGALAAAARLAQEALRVEPDPRLRVEHIALAAQWLVDVGDFAGARALLDPALELPLDPAPLGQLLLIRAEAEIANRPQLVAFVERAAAVDDDRVRWEALLRLAQHGHWVRGDVEGALATADEALAAARRLEDDGLVAESRGVRAYYADALGTGGPPDPDEAAPPPQVRAPWWSVGPGTSLAARLMWAGHLDAARRAAANEHQALTTAGREARAAFALLTRAEIELRAGRTDDSHAAAAEATDVLGDLILTAMPRLQLLVLAGLVDEAHGLGAAMLGWSARLADGNHPPRIHASLALLELSRGDPAAALLHAETAQAGLEASAIRNPGYANVLPDLIEALALTDRLEEAERAAHTLDEQAACVDTPWAAALASRGRALVALAGNDTDAALAHADAAAEAFAALGAPFDHARALLLAGNGRRRANERRAAAACLAPAAEIFARLGAPLWSALAEQELRRASPRAGGDRDTLTAAEERVAALVAAGRTNKETAAELFTTVATVEAHLTRIYRKLGIRSRTELARRIGEL